MSVEIRIPAPLRRFTGGTRAVQAAGATVGEVLQDAVRQYPELGPRLFTAEGGVRGDARVFVGGDEPEGELLAAAVTAGAVVTILPPIAGA